MTPIDLQSFCAKDDIRTYLMTPFVIDGHTYATNGHIIVRVLGGDPDPEQAVPEPVRQTALKMFATEYTDYEPPPEIPAPQACSECAGTGQGDEDECEDCDGHGEFTRGNHEYDCKECDGSGKVPGGKCPKYGCWSGQMRQPIWVGPAFIDGRYLRLIAALPNARIRVVGPEAAAAFIFDGGEGRVMPCREK